MDNFRFVKCPICGWEKNPRMSCFNCGDKAPASSKASSDTALAAAEAGIAELLAREQREAERRKKQGLILDYAMRGLRHSAEHPDDGRMQAVRALAEHSERQADRIAALEKALEPFARDTDYRITDDTPVTLSMVNHLTVGDLRRAAALLKEKE